MVKTAYQSTQWQNNDKTNKTTYRGYPTHSLLSMWKYIRNYHGNTRTFIGVARRKYELLAHVMSAVYI